MNDATEDDGDDSAVETRPSLPIILVSAALGLAGAVIGLYVTYIALGWELEPSVFAAVLCLSFGLGVTGAGLSAVTGTGATLQNIGFSCGLIAFSTVFLGGCMLVGALAATFVLMRL
jgi:hypothetical protein